MVKDYAKPPAPKAQAKASSSSSKWTLIIIAALLIAIAIPAGFFIAKLWHPSQHTKPVATAEIVNAPTLAKTKSKPAIQFDFYNLLPKMTVEVAQSNHPTPGPLPVSAALDKSGYVLQVASLQNQNEAIRLQKQLKKMGFRCYLQHFKHQSGMIWYRVLVGPYVTKSHATRTQDQLAHHALTSLVLKLPN